MKWNHEEKFDDVATFLGNLFNKVPEEITQRFVNIPELYVLTFKDDSNIKGVLISIRDETAYNYLELLYAVFEPDYDFKKSNVFNKLMNYCKKEYIDVIYAHTINEKSFVNIDIQKLSNSVKIYNRIKMNLSRSEYRDKWYDKAKNNLPKSSTDRMPFHKKFKVSRKKKSKKFTFVGLKDVSWTSVAGVQNQVYSSAEFEDNMIMLSKKSLDFNISLIKKLFSGYYGKLGEETSIVAIDENKFLAGYIICLSPEDKRGYITEFGVHPDYQSFGLGKALFRNAVINYFEKLNCDSIGLEITKENSQVINFYRMNGFEITEEEFQEGILEVD